MTPAGGVYSLSLAPTSTKSRFAALFDRHIVDSNGADLDRDGIFDLQLFVKLAVHMSKPSKKRRGRRPLSCIGTSASTASGNMFSAHCQIDELSVRENSSSRPRSDPVSYTDGSTATCSSGSCCSSCKPANFMGQGYEHPGPGHPHTSYVRTQTETIEPHSGICCIEPHSGIWFFDSDIAVLDHIDIHSSETVSFAETLVFLNWFLRECHEGVGGIEVDSVGVVGVGGLVGVGGSSGKICF